jgi:hypothetical protein
MRTTTPIVNAYGCTECHAYHYEGDELYAEHLWRQSKHGIQRLPLPIEPILRTQTSASHTPGPWTCRPVDDGSYALNPSGIGWLRCSKDETFANARLIEAAPELRAEMDPDTLEAIAEEIGQEFKHTARAESLRILARRQRALLARIDGREEAN